MIRNGYIITAAMLALLASSASMEAFAGMRTNNHSQIVVPETSQELTQVIETSTVNMHNHGSEQVGMANTARPVSNQEVPQDLFASPAITVLNPSAAQYDSTTRGPKSAEMASEIGERSRNILKSRAAIIGSGHRLSVEHIADPNLDVYSEEKAHTTATQESFIAQMRSFTRDFSASY